MLQQIRDHLTGWVAVIIFAPLILAFALWGIQNYRVGGRNFAAKVNGQEIPINEVREAVRNRVAMYQRFAPNGLSPEQEAQIRGDVLESFIQREVLSQRVQKQGYRASDAELTKAIHAIPQFQVDGKFDYGAYERVLGLQGYSPSRFEDSMRQDLSTKQLEDGLVRSSFATPDEVRRRIALEDEQREVAWAAFPAASHAADVTVPDADVQARYEARKNEFVTPETVSLEYIELRADQIASGVEVSESEIREQYDADVASGRFQKPEERRARHILLKLDGQDEAGVESKAEDLLARARAGEDFGQLARDNSADEASAKDGGELGWVTRDMMVGPFSDALFGMAPGQISDPVKTDFGLHIIQLEEVRGGEVRPYEEVHDELAQELRQKRADSLFYDRAEELGQRAFESRDSLEPVAQALGLQVQHVDGVTRDRGEGIASEAAVRTAAFADNVLESGENSDVIDLGEGRAVVLRVADHKPEAQRPLEEVRGEIEAQLREEAARQEANVVATDVLAKLREGGVLEDLAKEHGGEFHAAGFIARKAAPPELATAAFAAPKPSADAPYEGQFALANGDPAVFVLTAVKAGGGIEQTAEQRQTSADATAREYANADISAYVAQLRDEASVVTPKEQLEQLTE